MSSEPATDFGRKRSDFRRPSALGVPDAQFERNSEYLSNYEKLKAQERERHPFPQDQQLNYGSKSSSLSISDAPMKGLKTENQRAYKTSSDALHEAKLSSNVRPLTSLKSDGLDFDKGTLNGNEYGNISGSKKVSLARPSSNIRAEGDIDWSASNDEFYSKQGAKATQARPSSNLRSEGDRDWSTGRNDYTAFDLSSRKPSKAKMDDNLKPLDGRMDESTESRAQYASTQMTKKQSKLRPSSTMRAEGDQEWATGRAEYATFDGKQKPLKVKSTNDTLRPLEGKLDESSVSRSEYSGHLGQKVGPLRPSSHMKAEGQREWATSVNEYKGHSESKPEKAKKASDNLRPLEGRLENATESRAQYKGEYESAERPGKVRPYSSLRSEGDLDWTTTGREEYKAHENGFARRERAKMTDNLRPLNGSMTEVTESRNEYTGYADQSKIALARPLSFIRLEGDRDWSTGRHDLKVFEKGQARTDRSKADDNLKPLEGRLSTDTESNSRYKWNDPVASEKAKATQGYLKRSDGTFDGLSEHRERYVPHKEVGPAPKLRPTTSMISQGDIDMTTTKKSEYNVHVGKPVQPIKQTAVLKYEGLDFAQGTANHEYLKNVAIKSRQRPQVKDNLVAAKGKIDGNSTSKTVHNALPIEKVKKASAPNDNLKIRSKSADYSSVTSTTLQDYSASFGSTKPLKVRIGSSLKAPGGIEGGSEYKDQFGGSISLADLRAKPNWYSEIATPYGYFAQGQPRPLGQQLQSVV